MKQRLIKFLHIDFIDAPVHRFRSNTDMLVMIALLSAIAAILQSMGGFLPGIGYAISPFSTAAIFLANWLFPKRGILAYLLTIVLLWIIQPSELVVFPFTTGILGVVLGLSMHFLKNRLIIVFLSGAGLTMGIQFVLSVLRFPLLGPVAETSFSLHVFVYIFIFSIVYSWVWLEASLFFMKKYIRRKK